MNQIIDHDTDVGFVPPRFPSLFSWALRGINSRQQASAGFFIPVFIDLPCEEQPFQRGGF